MEFKPVIQTCLDFSIANGGTIQSYPVSQPDRLGIESRTTRTAIFVGRAPGIAGHWLVKQLQDAAGNKTLASATVSTSEGLQAQLQSFWDKKDLISHGDASISGVDQSPAK